MLYHTLYGDVNERATGSALYRSGRADVVGAFGFNENLRRSGTAHCGGYAWSAGDLSQSLTMESTVYIPGYLLVQTRDTQPRMNAQEYTRRARCHEPR